MPSLIRHQSGPSHAQALPATARSPLPGKLAGRSTTHAFASDLADHRRRREPEISLPSSARQLNPVPFFFIPGYGTRSQPIWRACKGHDRDALDRLHQKGYFSNPASKAKSVAFSDAGRHEAERVFTKLFS
jgi:hypothetical protein